MASAAMMGASVLLSRINPTPRAPAGTLRPMPNSQPLQIFRAGRHTAANGETHTITRAQLVELAESYEPSVCEAPIVVGHPQANAPAYGWAKKVYVDGDTLMVEPHQVDPAFAEMVNSGRFKKISASFYTSSSPGNPKPGRMYLRHVGFLGAQPPAVRGLRDASFAASNEGVIEFGEAYAWRSVASLFRRVRDWVISTAGLDVADQALPSWEIDGLQAIADEPSTAFSESETTVPDTTVNFAEREAAITQRETELAAREAAVARTEEQSRQAAATAHRTVCVEFAEQLVEQGRLLPRQQAAVVELLVVNGGAAELSFAEGDGTVTRPAGDVLRELLATLPVQINYSEKSRATNDGGPIEFAAPAGALVDPEHLQIHRRALDYQRSHAGVSYETAVDAVIASA